MFGKCPTAAPRMSESEGGRDWERERKREGEGISPRKCKNKQKTV